MAHTEGIMTPSLLFGKEVHPLEPDNRTLN